MTGVVSEAEATAAASNPTNQVITSTVTSTTTTTTCVTATTGVNLGQTNTPAAAVPVGAGPKILPKTPEINKKVVSILTWN